MFIYFDKSGTRAWSIKYGTVMVAYELQCPENYSYSLYLYPNGASEWCIVLFMSYLVCVGLFIRSLTKKNTKWRQIRKQLDQSRVYIKLNMCVQQILILRVHPNKLTGECSWNYKVWPLDIISCFHIVSTTFPHLFFWMHST